MTDQLALTDADSLAEALTIDGSQAGTFAVLWEFLDDGYIEEGYFAWKWFACCTDGIAIEDVACALKVYQKALETGVGQW